MEGRRELPGPDRPRGRRRRWALAVAAAALGLAGLAYQRVGTLRVRLANLTAAPLVDVRFEYPGGSIVFPEVRPGVAARGTLRLASDGEAPVIITFRQGGEASRPFRVRYDLSGMSDRDAYYSVWDRPGSGVEISADVAVRAEFYPRNLLRILTAPSGGWAGVYLLRCHSQSARVIDRPNRGDEARDWLELGGYLALFAADNPFRAARIAYDVVRDRIRSRRRGPEPELRLPMIEREAESYPGAGLHYRDGLRPVPADGPT